MLSVQVLVAAMNQKDHALLDRMNIASDVIVGNQCERNEVEAFDYHGFRAKYLSFAERGVGLNRNNALMRADGDILLFADDDMRYLDGYADTVRKVFERHPEADVIIFNLDEEIKDMSVGRVVNSRDVKVGWLNFLRYGTARVAVRREAVRAHGITFNQCFGGGTEHRHGEDNLFLADCLKNGLKIVAVSETLAILLADKASTWNVGYDEEYLRDQGCLYRTMSRRWWRLFCLQDAVRKQKRYKMPWYRSYAIMTKQK